MPDILRYDTLNCLCGGTTFAPVFELRRHPSGGLVRQQVAEHCHACGAVANVQQMTNRVTHARRKREVAALEHELAELAGITPAPPVPAEDRGRRPL